MPDLWVPGSTGPSLEDFVGRLLRQIQAFAKRSESGGAHVEVELHDGALLVLHSISAEPGYGLITLRPYPEDEDRPWSDAEEGPLPPEEIMVPLGSIMRITLSEPEGPRSRFGFSGPAPS
jgi:hypothetical protein